MEGQEFNEWLGSHDKAYCYYGEHSIVLSSYRPWWRCFRKSYVMVCSRCGETVPEPRCLRQIWAAAWVHYRTVSPQGIMAPPVRGDW